ncbi:MAG: hypothetical protein AB7G21_07445 [Dehalococcoidia bacterium]
MIHAVLHLACSTGRRVGPRPLALLAALVLLAPSAVRLAGPDGAGWIAGHGHIYLSAEAAAHSHSHPWDGSSHTSTPPSSAGTATSEVAPGVLFTLGELDLAGALAMIALPVFGLLLAVGWRSEAITLPVALGTGRRARPLVPPPQP